MTQALPHVEEENFIMRDNVSERLYDSSMKLFQNTSVVGS